MKQRTVVLILLMLVMVISVLDKTIFAFAGAQIIDELKLSPTEFGFIGSAFFFLYSISGVLVGFLANRFPTRWILAGMSVVWMASQLLVALSSGFAACCWAPAPGRARRSPSTPASSGSARRSGCCPRH